MKYLFLLLLCLILFKNQAIAQNTTQKPPEEIVRTFVKWYSRNWEKLEKSETNTINMGSLELKKNREPPFYAINFQGVEKYITMLSQTGFFSEKYFEALRNWFKDADKNFKANPQNDGPPEGFQYDRFFLTQDDFLQDIKNIDNIKITGKLLKKNNADVRMHFPLCNITYRYGLSYKKGKWQIDSIITAPLLQASKDS